MVRRSWTHPLESSSSHPSRVVSTYSSAVNPDRFLRKTLAPYLSASSASWGQCRRHPRCRRPSPSWSCLLGSARCSIRVLATAGQSGWTYSKGGRPSALMSLGLARHPRRVDTICSRVSGPAGLITAIKMHVSPCTPIGSCICHSRFTSDFFTPSTSPRSTRPSSSCLLLSRISAAFASAATLLRALIITGWEVLTPSSTHTCMASSRRSFSLVLSRWASSCRAAFFPLSAASLRLRLASSACSRDASTRLACSTIGAEFSRLALCASAKHFRIPARYRRATCWRRSRKIGPKWSST
mmetsp:Transcript_68332/g.156913  ORF Transcript_68332/g.156913 Transcript_68332/m.156913 type:complete len:297 (+) Transcript_68332:176-1066(+)